MFVLVNVNSFIINSPGIVLFDLISTLSMCPTNNRRRRVINIPVVQSKGGGNGDQPSLKPLPIAGCG